MVTLDIVMPKMNGSALARELRDKHAELRVIYMSGYVGDVLDSHELLESGTAMLQKPFSGKEMIATVRRLLDEPMT